MCILKKSKGHTSPHTHRTTVKLWGTHHSVAQWDECDRVMHTEKISETMMPQSEPYNFVLCFLGSTNKKKKALCGISARAGYMAPSSFRSPHAWLRQETCGTVVNTELKSKKKKELDSEVRLSVCTPVKRPKVTAANVSDTRRVRSFRQ